MAANTEKAISTLIPSQLPEFIRAEYPKFQRFIELYYDWLERSGTFTNNANTYYYGNTTYHMMNAEKYKDVDETPDEFLTYFRRELLPYFPETTALSLPKILKGAREFYNKKGSEESLKWLFRVLFDEEVEVFYPKKQILVASDGKWFLPKAFQLTLSAANEGVNITLLNKTKGVGSVSKATCVIESANMTVDRIFGNRILEIFVSNVDKEFQNGEYLEIEYVDENGETQLFVEKIVGAISNIFVDSNINTDPQQKRRGLLYNVGDPIVVYGGLDNSLVAQDAIASVGNVTTGSIESISMAFPGYGYRVYSDGELSIQAGVSDDPAGVAAANIRISTVNTNISTIDSQLTFGEYITVDKMPIEFLSSVVLSGANYTQFTGNNRNIAITAQELVSSVIYLNDEAVYANGSSWATANFKGYIATTNSTSGFGLGGAACTTGLILHTVSNTQVLTTTGFLSGQTLTGANSGKTFTVTAINNVEVPANINSKIVQSQSRETLLTGGISEIDINNGGYGFKAAPVINADSYFDTFKSDDYSYSGDPTNYKAWRQSVDTFGKIAHVYILSGGSGYSDGDQIRVSGRGYGFTGYVNVSSGGVIVKTTITNRGEGYYGTKSTSVSSSGGTGAVLTSYGFGEGADYDVTTGSIGRIQDIRVTSRGYDYISAPIVSLKVVDMVADVTSGLAQDLEEGEYVYQGDTLESAVFSGRIKYYDTITRVLRLFDYSGNSQSNFNPGLDLTSQSGVVLSIDTTSTVPAPDEYPTAIRASGLPSPWFYGNGRAKAYAEFYNGLIKYPGYYLNYDGFLSADKKTQDGYQYHNYSYTIQSGISLNDYEATIKDTVHPIGTKMLASAISSANSNIQTNVDSEVFKISSNSVATNVSISAFDSGTALAVIYGANTMIANVGDMIVINSNSATRFSVKTIRGVANTNTTLDLDFTRNDYNLVPSNTTILTLEGNTRFTVDANLDFIANSNVAYTSANLQPMIAPGDFIRFEIPEYRRNVFVQTGALNNTSIWVSQNNYVNHNFLTNSSNIALWSKTSNTNISADVSVGPISNAPVYNVACIATGICNANKQASTSISGNTATFSIYAKIGSSPTEANWFAIRNSTTSTTLLTFRVNYTSGAITYSVGSTGASATNVGNGWWKIKGSISGTSSLKNGDLLLVYAGFVGGTNNIGEFAYFSAPQLELGWTSSHYTPTGSSIVPILYSAPDGTNTAFRFVEDQQTSTNSPLRRVLQQSKSMNSSIGEIDVTQPFTTSFYVKPIEALEQVQLTVYDGAGANLYAATYTLVGSGAISYSGLIPITGSGTFVDHGISLLDDGWYRIYASITLGINAGTTTQIQGRLMRGGATAYTGDGQSGAYFWCPQMEQGIYASDPIVTTSSPVTSNTEYYSIHTANVISVSSSALTLNTQQRLIMSDATDIEFEVYPTFNNVQYQIVSSV